MNDPGNEVCPETNDCNCCIKALCHVCRDRAERIIHINNDWGLPWCGDSDCQADIMQRFNVYEDDMPVEPDNMADENDIMADGGNTWEELLILHSFDNMVNTILRNRQNDKQI